MPLKKKLPILSDFIVNIVKNIENHPFLSSIYQFIQNYSDMLDNSMDLDESYDYDVDLEY